MACGERSRAPTPPTREKVWKGKWTLRLKWRILVNFERYYDKIWGLLFALASPFQILGDSCPFWGIVPLSTRDFCSWICNTSPLNDCNIGMYHVMHTALHPSCCTVARLSRLIVTFYCCTHSRAESGHCVGCGQL